MILVKTTLRLVLYTALAVLSAFMIRQDAALLVDGRKFIENSYTEWTQAAFLLLSILVFAFVGRRFVPLRPVSYVVAGVLGVFLIREMDAHLDRVYHGAWLPVALVALAVTVYLGYRERHRLAESIERFLATPAFGFFIAGGLGFFVFARLFGAKGIWLAVFQLDVLDPESPARWVKNAVEEGSELFGYCLVLCAAIELLSWARRQLPTEENRV